MTAVAELPLHVRSARAIDEALLLAWANDAKTRANAFSPHPISAEVHQAWFHARLQKAASCRFYIVETDSGVPAGQVRFEEEGDAWEVHYALGPSFRGLGLGRPMLESAITQFRKDVGEVAVYGKVKESNGASRRIFEALGFKTQVGAVPGVIKYNLTESCIKGKQ